jgi:hypothetical protein
MLYLLQRRVLGLCDQSIQEIFRWIRHTYLHTHVLHTALRRQTAHHYHLRCHLLNTLRAKERPPSYDTPRHPLLLVKNILGLSNRCHRQHIQ